jgi:hypothetical protein
VPVTKFLNAQRLADDVKKLNDAARAVPVGRRHGPVGSCAITTPFVSPKHFKLSDLFMKFDKRLAPAARATARSVRTDDARRREAPRGSLELPLHCGHVVPGPVQLRLPPHRALHHPLATQEGEISFCAYNTGIGWRNIIEKMHMTATLTKWYEEHGRHEIIAGNKNVALPSTAHSLELDREAVAKSKQTDLDEKGIAKTAREEKLRARKVETENKRMADLYRQVVLKEPKPELATGLQIQGLGKKKVEDEKETVAH